MIAIIGCITRYTGIAAQYGGITRYIALPRCCFRACEPAVNRHVVFKLEAVIADICPATGATGGIS